MFEIVNTDVFTRAAFLTRSLQERLSNDSELDFGGVLGARSAHILLFEPLVSASLFCQI